MTEYPRQFGGAASSVDIASEEPAVRRFSKGDKPYEQAFLGIVKMSAGGHRVHLELGGKEYSFDPHAMIKAMSAPEDARTAEFEMECDGQNVRHSLSMEAAGYYKSNFEGTNTTLMDRLGFEGGGYGHWDPNVFVPGKR